jgi:hypothetical protein
MKTVFSNSEIVHIFAQQSQQSGRSGNMFFEGNKIYSYGRHYLLAEILSETNTIVINDKGYSNTTQKHISLITQATRQYKQYFTKQVDLALVYEQIIALNDRLPRAIKKEIICNDIISLFDGLQSFLFEFNKENQLADIRFKEIKAIYESISANEDAYILAAKEREQKKKLADKAKLTEDSIKFMNYEIGYINSKSSNIDFIRISQDRQYIETSQQVRIAIDEAKVLYKLIASGKDIKGYRISNYTVLSLNGVLQIGCHRIDVKNMHEVGKNITTV